MEERRNGERGSQMEWECHLRFCMPVSLRLQQPCKWELCETVGRGRGLEHPGGRLEKGSREREI